MCVCVCEKNKLQYALKSATFSTLVACHGLPQISLHSKLPFHRLIRLRHRWWRLSLSPKLDNAPKLCFASPKAVWTYMSVFIGKNVDKPLDLGVCYFQTKSASEVDLEILSWNHQQVHWRVRYAYHKLHSLTRSFGPRCRPHELIEAQQRHIATKRLQPHRTGDSQGSSQDSTDHGWNPWKNPTK